MFDTDNTMKKQAEGVQVSVFFFLKQKKAYEMRMSDGSSDVCSSDLALQRTERRRRAACRLVIAVGRDMENAVRLVPHRLRQRGGRQDYHRDRGHRSPHRHSSLPRFSAPMELRRALFGEGGAAFLRIVGREADRLQVEIGRAPV